MQPSNSVVFLAMFLLVIATFVHGSDERYAYESIYFIGRNESGSNLTCKDEMYPCITTDQIINAAMIEVSNIVSDNITRLDSFTMIIKVLNGYVNWDTKPFDFANYTKTFNLFFIRNQNSLVEPSFPPLDSIINELGYVGAIFFAPTTFSNSIDKLIFDECDLRLNIDSTLSNLIIRNSTVRELLVYENIASTNITYSSMGQLFIDTAATMSVIEIDNCYLTISFSLINFNQFTMRNSIWEASYLSRFTNGEIISIFNTTTNSPCIFLSISRIILDNILISNINYGNYFHQFIQVKELFISNSQFSNNIIIDSKHLFSLQLVYNFTLQNCKYESNSGGGFIFITDTSNNQESTNVYYLYKSIFINNQLADAAIFYVSGLDSNYPILKAHHLKFYNNTSGNKNSHGSCFEISGYCLVIIKNSTFVSNRAELGGAIYTASPKRLSIEDSIFSRNSATLGGAIYMTTNKDDHFEINNSECDRNFASNAGGCVYIEAYFFQSDFFQFSNNTALWYGNDVASSWNVITIEDSRDPGLDVNQYYAGETVIWNVYLMDNIYQTASFVNQLTMLSEDAIISQSIQKGDQFVIVRFQILPKTLGKIIEISLSVSSIQHVLKKNLQVEIVKCPFSYTLEESESGYSCTYVPLDIIIPTVIFGFISILIVFGSAIYGLKILVRKLMKLRKQEKAENEIEEKFNNKDFIFETTDSESTRLISKSINQNERNQYIIPISEIEIIKKIGEGAMGAVYHARWNRTDIAIKKLKTDTNDEEFEKESILMSSLRHPSIVSCFGVSITSTTKYIVVEYMANGSLEKALYDSKRGGQILKFSKKLQILIDISKGMTYLHSIKPYKIIHRDLKSANVLLDKHLNAKVGDFGLSKVVSGVSTMTANVGTLLYCGPEILSNQDYKGQSTKLDVYSFGILMWEILFESLPYSNELNEFSNSFTILLKVIKGHRPTLLFGNTFENVTTEWLQHNFTKKQLETLGKSKIIEYLITYLDLMQKCWNQDPSLRPEFILITDLLADLQQEF